MLVADVADPAACERLVAESAEALGGLDGVVLNVGILGPFGLAGTTAEDWDRVFAVNARAHALVAGAALAVLEDGSSLVFMSSMSAFMPGIGMPAYDATKAAVTALARHTAMEGAPRGIRANAVLPGVVDTPLGADTPRPDGPPRERLKIPLGRRGHAPGTWPTRRSSCSRARPPTSPPRRSWSTGASRPWCSAADAGA